MSRYLDKCKQKESQCYCVVLTELNNEQHLESTFYSLIIISRAAYILPYIISILHGLAVFMIFSVFFFS